ncbi:MAG TPA: dienelactone hydrolase family protein [Pseudonocardiaceae bacterium]|nr:dienelactone hydrolase family protein [Pseudonocardiaceae bacterium]
MSELVLFHSVLGVRPAVLSWAERLRSAGHVVHVPDLYGGPVFDSYEEANEFVQAFGSYPELLRRTAAAVEDLRPDLVYAGFSNGAGGAAYLVTARRGARGALLMHGVLPLAVIEQVTGEPAAWPASVPAQVHYARDDKFRQESSVQSFIGELHSAGATVEYFEYPGDGHLFADSSLPDEFDEDAAELMWGRTLEFLARTDAVR